MVLYFTFAFALVGDGEFENAEALFPHRNVRHALTSRRVTTSFSKIGEQVQSWCAEICLFTPCAGLEGFKGSWPRSSEQQAIALKGKAKRTRNT